MSVTTLRPGESLIGARRRLDRSLKAQPASSQQPDRDPYIAAERKYLTLDQGAALLCFDVTAPSRPRQHFLEFLKRNAIPMVRRGRTYLVEARVLEAVIRRDF